ncbi:sugar ABC transporter ATP-binding protein [Pararobbsia silviterrae]|uniref:Sugar ABC transporter ATP-binding protein n=1 Tax=Pararobbsia silviterrae TaxID=1792498 RepID=A0A494Y5B5_9BURK|nr:sugar ABC transporter ATP-binding protein [Pararobbsia silviterrae]RKP55761.1 sugar ABC transporter ATP-binding protein [Pararobbsia silviterrae]
MTSTVSVPELAIDLEGIVKQFGAHRALDGASLRVARGSVHGLVGENGAGKSTLIKVLAGIHAPDAGIIRIGGHTVADLDPSAVESLGVHFIHQDRLLAPSFTVGEALFLGREIRKGPWLDRRAMQRRAAEVIHSLFDVTLPPGARIAELNTAQQQIVQISRALLANPSVLVFDEPTASLVKREVDQLLGIIRRLRDSGLTIIYISHYLQEIEALCDAVTILRNGRDVGVVDPAATPVAEIARRMVNRDVAEMYPRHTASRGNVVLDVQGLTLDRAYDDVSLSVHRGEVVGLTGLVGSGAKALVRSLFGLESPDAGTIAIDAAPVTLRSPREAVTRGIALVPEDRRAQGIAPSLSVTENATLASLRTFSRLGFLSRVRERSAVARLIDDLAIRTPGPHALARQLSGGNQQKVALAKWLSRQSRLYILDEPTVGVDIGAKVEIYKLIATLVEGGAGVLVLSSDLQELIGICDRVAVMYRGRIARTFDAGEADSDALLACATGAHARDAHASDTGALSAFGAAQTPLAARATSSEEPTHVAI